MDEYISKRAAAALLHVSHQTFIAKIDAGIYKLSYLRMGQRFIFKRKEIEDYLKKGFVRHDYRTK